MRLEIRTLRRTVCALLMALMLLAGFGEIAFAQRHRHGDNDRGRHLGWTRGRHRGWARHDNDDRRFRRRAFNRRFRNDRRALLWRDRARGDRVGFGPRVFNRRQRFERRALRRHQRIERRDFRRNF